MKIKNWSKFQHFKDRRPPWVKLYRDILDDMEWHELDPLASKVLVMCWLIASEDDGNIPTPKTLAFRLRMTEKQTIDCLNKLSHWLEQDDNNVISERYQDDLPETETETETKKEEKKNVQRGTRLPVDFVFPSEWIAFCQQERQDLNPHKVFDEFKDYWCALPAGKGTKTDWTATWRNWVRRQNAPKQVLQNKFDVAHITTPTPKNHDAALRKIEEDAKKAAPIPANIREKMAAILGSKA